MAPRDISTFLSSPFAPSLVVHGWCLGSRIINRARESPVKVHGLGSSILQQGYACGYYLRASLLQHESPAHSAHLHYLALALLGCCRHLGICFLHLCCCPRERDVPAHTRGPKLAACSRQWLAYRELIKGESFPVSDLHAQLHRQYGEIVRWAPNEVRPY
ncbi:hypothetical protein H4582DRAFT_1229124 [Lactarius indigo]|nr:hypothetical protein H4582DRAFT_1229124 [Lactarius indigo]